MDSPRVRLAEKRCWQGAPFGLDGDENFGVFPIGVAGNGLLIFRPEPCSNSFLDVGESLLFVLPLRYTSGQGRAFHDNPTIFRLIERHVKDHADILPIATLGYNVGCFQVAFPVLARVGKPARLNTARARHPKVQDRSMAGAPGTQRTKKLAYSPRIEF